MDFHTQSQNFQLWDHPLKDKIEKTLRARAKKEEEPVLVHTLSFTDLRFRFAIEEDKEIINYSLIEVLQVIGVEYLVGLMRPNGKMGFFAMPISASADVDNWFELVDKYPGILEEYAADLGAFLPTPAGVVRALFVERDVRVQEQQLTFEVPPAKADDLPTEEPIEGWSGFVWQGR